MIKTSGIHPVEKTDGKIVYDLWLEYARNHSPELKDRLIIFYMGEAAAIAKSMHRRLPSSIRVETI